MPKDFITEIRSAYENKYLKVFITDISNISNIGDLIQSLDSVSRVNVTSSTSKNNPELTLTVYPKKMYEIKEVELEVTSFLTTYFNSYRSKVIDKDITEAKTILADHKKSLKVFEEGVEKIHNKKYERNALDDMRVSLELFLKDVLNNDKSLENQLSDVGRFNNEKGRSKEFTQMFRTLLDYYNKYQNNHVKHNDAVNEDEIDFVVNLTINFMKNFRN